MNKCLLLQFQVLVVQIYDPDGLKSITKISQILLTQTVKLSKQIIKVISHIVNVHLKLFYSIYLRPMILFGNHVICDATVAENRH